MMLSDSITPSCTVIRALAKPMVDVEKCICGTCVTLTLHLDKCKAKHIRGRHM